MSRPIVVYGAGGRGREILALINDLRHAGAEWEFLGFLSDDQSSWGTIVAGAPVLGNAAWAAREGGVSVGLGVGGPAARRRVVAALEPYGVGFQRWSIRRRSSWTGVRWAADASSPPGQS